MMTNERSGDSGASPPSGWSGDYSGSADEKSTGWSTSGDGSGIDGGNRRNRASERIRWAGVAGSLIAIVIILTQMWGTLTGNEEKSQQIQNQLEQFPDAIDNLQNTIQDRPTPVSTTIVQKGEPGKPGKPGKPGPVVTAPPKTVIVEKPGPTETVTVEPKPTCNTSLVGTCIVP